VNQTQAGCGEVVIRRARAADAGALSAMLSGLSDLALYFRFQTAVGRPPRDSLVEPLVSPTGAAWVAERDGMLVGHGMWAWAKGSTVPTAELAVVIAESDQRRGLGVRLMKLAAAAAHAAGATQLLLVVSAANDRVLRMIRRHLPISRAERDGALVNFVVPAGLGAEQVEFELEVEPAGQVLDLVVDGGGDGLAELDVLVNGVDPQYAGLAVGGGVHLPDQAVAGQDR
jgi:ribosomal protein S18 acetylase RimI-like enzyme